MRLVGTLAVFWLASVIAACGEPGDSAQVPAAQPAGETSADIGDYVVHFSAQSTADLPPEIARAYNILRSKNRAMLNVSVIRKADGVSINASVEVTTRNLTGQLKSVTMRRIEEPGETTAIYYIGETPVANRETLIFDISITPEGERAAAEIRFKRQFYTDS